MYTFQALSEEDRELWLDAMMDGNEPMFVHPPKPSNANQVKYFYLLSSLTVLEYSNNFAIFKSQISFDVEFT